MARPVLSKRERGQEANGDARPDRELREANRHLHEFLDLLGHELRSPLAAIFYALRILELQGDDAATRERARSMMERQTQCISRLVEDMLEVSRIEHGKIQLCKQPLDLAQSVSRAVETVRASVEGRGHQLEVTLPQEPVTFDADPRRLEQVLTNLLNNAAKYMEPGGCIWLTAEVEGGDVVLRVRDSGVGIDPDMLAACFRSLLAGRAHARSFAGRTGHRPGAGSQVGGDARGQRQRVAARDWAAAASSSCAYQHVWTCWRMCLPRSRKARRCVVDISRCAGNMWGLRRLSLPRKRSCASFASLVARGRMKS